MPYSIRLGLIQKNCNFSFWKFDCRLKSASKVQSRKFYMKIFFFKAESSLHFAFSKVEIFGQKLHQVSFEFAMSNFNCFYFYVFQSTICALKINRPEICKRRCLIFLKWHYCTPQGLCLSQNKARKTISSTIALFAFSSFLFILRLKYFFALSLLTFQLTF